MCPPGRAKMMSTPESFSARAARTPPREGFVIAAEYRMPAVAGPSIGVMRAAFFEGYQCITVRDAPLPEPASGEVRLKVRYCGICGSDVTCYKTGALAGPDEILGHELSAVVDLDPAGEWNPGRRVTVFPSGTGCGECVWCREEKYRYCLNHTHSPQPVPLGNTVTRLPG